MDLNFLLEVYAVDIVNLYSSSGARALCCQTFPSFPLPWPSISRHIISNIGQRNMTKLLSMIKKLVAYICLSQSFFQLLEMFVQFHLRTFSFHFSIGKIILVLSL